MQRPIVLKYWRIIRYKTLIIQCVPEGKPEKRFCYESSVGKPCAFTGKACTDFKCIDKAVVCNTTIAGLSPASTSKRVGEDGYLESFISSRPRFKSETRYTKF